MLSLLSPITRIHKTLAVLDQSDDGEWCAEAIRSWLAGMRFETACGLAPGWRRVMRVAQQECALRALIACLPPAGSGRATAAFVSVKIRRYLAAGWVIDKRTGRRPSGVSGLIYDYAQARGPVSPGRLRARLATPGRVT